MRRLVRADVDRRRDGRRRVLLRLRQPDGPRLVAGRVARGGLDGPGAAAEGIPVDGVVRNDVEELPVPQLEDVLVEVVGDLGADRRQVGVRISILARAVGLERVVPESGQSQVVVIYLRREHARVNAGAALLDSLLAEVELLLDTIEVVPLLLLREDGRIDEVVVSRQRHSVLGDDGGATGVLAIDLLLDEDRGERELHGGVALDFYCIHFEQPAEADEGVLVGRVSLALASGILELGYQYHLEAGQLRALRHCGTYLLVVGDVRVADRRRGRDEQLWVPPDGQGEVGVGVPEGHRPLLIGIEVRHVVVKVALLHPDEINYKLTKEDKMAAIFNDICEKLLHV